ncbi:tRNA (guanine-N(1)-)-methyltransferase [Termitomyces sp. J132]|nr:tRNA (guanine-N(1)-)-methyltransferase [Termitomyces sp. J132]
MSDDQQRPVQPDTPEPGPPQSLSKNALKKAARAERFAAYKVERRAREKEAKKEKKRMLRAKCAAGEIGEDEKRRKKKPRLHFGGRVVVDLGFDDKMNEKEIKSLCSQLAYTYSANRNATYPFSLVYTSLNGRTLTRLEGMNDAGYKRWTNTEWWPESYERLTVGSQENIRHNIIYLTADSEEELTELKPEETYIIGGICDHNRYKNLCLKRAKESGIRTARLPIGRYLASLPTRKVLTVNQVFEILLKWVETKSWEEALYAVVPKRKYQIGKSVSSMANSDNAEDREDRDEDADKPDSSVVVIEQAEAVEA